MSETGAEQQKESRPLSRSLVNPHSLKECWIRLGETDARILDLSFLRVVVEETEGIEFPEGAFPALLQLDRHQLEAKVVFRSRRPGWLRFEFDKTVPSAQAHLRSFLSAKKVGESILIDGVGAGVQHYHGLNESELWADEKGGILFTYLDPQDPKVQFIVRVADENAQLRVGRMPREEFMKVADIDGELPLASLTDREIYAKLSECRDIVTNLRPIGPQECALKQRLLKLISENLYSTSTRVNMWVPRTPKTTTHPIDGAGLS